MRMPRNVGIDRPENYLLRRLDRNDFARIARDLAEVEIDRDRVLYHPGDTVETVYFPCGASVASFVLSLDDGREVDTLVVGQEGAVAGIVNQSRLPAYSRITVQRGGKFVTLEATKLEAAKQRSSAMRGLFARYADGLIAQLLQSIACNAAHSIEQRTARWIAAGVERTGEDILPMTHAQLARMLGVGRSYASRVLKNFKAERILEIRRGALLIRDASALRAKGCRCDDGLKRHLQELFANDVDGRDD
jgi:CRP-like cAMP-binding protein